MIRTTLLLAVRPAGFLLLRSPMRASSGLNGSDLSSNTLTLTFPSDGEKLPRWLAHRKDYSIWQRNNC